MTFQLDTSGTVYRVYDGQERHLTDQLWTWSDLNPFTQGYVEAVMRSLWDEYENIRRSLSQPYVVGTNDQLARLQAKKATIAYYNIAPETLARIMEDCAARLRGGLEPNTLNAGHLFWGGRKNGRSANFPPLTPYLADDGKVRFREAV